MACCCYFVNSLKQRWVIVITMAVGSNHTPGYPIWKIMCLQTRWPKIILCGLKRISTLLKYFRRRLSTIMSSALRRFWPQEHLGASSPSDRGVAAEISRQLYWVGLDWCSVTQVCGNSVYRILDREVHSTRLGYCDASWYRTTVFSCKYGCS
jgi:hypothetical protein